MSTRSTITVYYPSGLSYYITVYCHSDGYPEHHLPILTEHYDTLEKAFELVKNGDMSVLAEKCNCPQGHSYDHPIEGYTVYYHRDCGKDWEKTQPRIFDHWPNIHEVDMNQEYEYLFQDGAWRCRTARI